MTEPAIALLQKVLATSGHNLRCGFSGCTCGKVEAYKQVLGEIANFLANKPPSKNS